MTARFPLQWPHGRPRTPANARRRATFNQKVYNGRFHETRDITIKVALERLDFELDQLDALDVVLSTNVELRLDGRPRSTDRDPADPGAALWFTLNGKPIVLACDRWDRVADNICAIAKHIEAMRGMERWGVGNLAMAFTGYEALPHHPDAGAAPADAWWIVLDVDRAASLAEIDSAWRAKMRTAHPDQGGNPEHAKRLNAARDAARKERTYYA